MQYQTNNGTIYLLDANGDELFVGDYVECMVDVYSGICFGQKRRIQGFIGNNIVLNNSKSPRGISQYNPKFFKIFKRHHPEHRRYDSFIEENDTMIEGETLQVAISIPYKMTKEVFFKTMLNRSVEHSLNIISETSPHKLKESLKKRINDYPNERWFIINTQQIAEKASIPISIKEW